MVLDDRPLVGNAEELATLSDLRWCAEVECLNSAHLHDAVKLCHAVRMKWGC